MSFFFPKRTFSRRDIFKALTGSLRQDATPAAPTGVDPLARAADRLIEQKEYAQALPKLRALLRKSPDHVQALRKLGYCLVRTGDTAAAEETFARILKQHPRDPFALLHQGLNLAYQNRLPEAIGLWRQYFNTDQPIIQRAVNLQIALYETGGPNDPLETAEQIQKAMYEQERQDQG